MQGVEVVAQMMEIAAVTAPKTRGENYVQVKTLLGDEVRKLGEQMVAYGEEHHRSNFDRDGKNVIHSQAVVLIGVKDAKPAGLNCSACGYATCAELEEATPAEEEFKGPICAYRLLDMGIALGSAVKMAGLFNVDNRIMYRIGAVARANGWVDWDFVMGIPLSVSGKNIYFDR
ncbi:MAG: DUF2148 domain-containing protein [Anaerolineales bacterium]|nr:DUF2148 domain-containing protein [Anaerolineales bacterium]MCS7248260.1 DUF2148 domain-containing protein [Anaerolineales bacterium]MDW8162074.1 DUF2148 domain-containing protein [Anaerolineales bacterium]MDW8446236.1 DUF2148 domain-containing protein [Anaerolineales bacterium]